MRLSKNALRERPMKTRLRVFRGKELKDKYLLERIARNLI